MLPFAQGSRHKEVDKIAQGKLKFTITEIHSTISGIWVGSVAQNGSINWANAPPSGFAKVATAVAATLPRPVNHKSLYLVGALSTNG